MLQILQSSIKKIGHFFGLEIRRYPTAALRSRLAFLAQGNFDLVLDVGANIGQYGLEMRELGYGKEIISFEPLQTAFLQLKKCSVQDPNWTAHHYALGNSNFETSINVSSHLASSSLLDFNEEYLAQNEGFANLTKENIQVKRLDGIFSDLKKSNQTRSILLKLDTQGFEMDVLKGASGVIAEISGIQIETSIRELYQNETLFVEMLSYLKSLGFEIFTLEPYYYDPNTTQLLQVEVYLLRNIK
jgi:FkbM family methyltransferase